MSPPCIGKQELFDSTHINDHRKAARLCRGCPIKDDCLALALSEPSPVGTWGGKRFFARYVPVKRDFPKNRHPERWRAFMTPGDCNLPGCEEKVPIAPRAQRFYCCPQHRKRDARRRREFLLVA